MSATFTLSPPYKCNLYTISYSPTLAMQGSYTYSSSTYTNSPISIHNKYNSNNDTHTHHTHNHTPPYTPTQPPTPHAHTPTHPPLTPLTHTHLHTYTTPNTLICTPSPYQHKTLHYNIFKVSNLLQYTYCIDSCTVTITLHQHMNTILNIRTLIKVPFGSYRTNHHNAIRQPLS